MKTQIELIKNHLQTNGSITPIQALNLFGCFRLSARILDLRKSGMDIKTEKENNKSNNGSHAKYVIK